MDIKKLDAYVDEGLIFSEEKDDKVIYNCGDRELLKIIVFPDGSYECNFDDLRDDLDGFLDQIKFENEKRLAEIVPVFVDENGFKYISDKDVMNVIRKGAKDLLKKKLDKDSFIRAHIYQELINQGYENSFRLIDFDARDEGHNDNEDLNTTIGRVAYICNKKYSSGHYFDGETMVYYNGDQEHVDVEMDEIVEIIENVFGVNSDQHNELLDIFSSFSEKKEEHFKKIFLDSDYVSVVKDMFNYALCQYEKQYCKYIFENVKINFSLKQAYNVLSDELKTQLAEEMFYGDSLETKLVSDIVDIFSRRCNKKDSKVYNKKEIIGFLIDNLAKRVSVLMPEDFDVFKDLEIDANDELIDKYKKMADSEDYGGKIRR